MSTIYVRGEDLPPGTIITDLGLRWSGEFRSARLFFLEGRPDREEIDHAAWYLGQCKPAMRGLPGSHQMRHKAEDWCDSQGREHLGISNGAMIRAALETGIGIRWNGNGPDCSICVDFKALPKDEPEGAPPARVQLPPALRFSVLERCGFRCVYCGASAKDGATLEVDHVIPVAKGGDNDPANLEAACFACNRGKRDRLLATPPRSSPIPGRAD